jgi:heat shock protein HslJ
MRPLPILLLLALSISLLVGCASTIEPAAVDPLEGSEWRLSSLPGRNLAQVPVNRRPTVAFAEGRMSGRGLCNPLTAAYTPGESGQLRIGRVGGATAPCREVESLEPHFIRQLEDVTGYRLDGDRLVLVTGTGRELGFERLPMERGAGDS